MKTFRRKAIQMGCIFMLLMVLCYMAGVFRQSPEPVYEGKKLSAWAKVVCSPGLLSSTFATPALRAQNDRAVAAIRQIGTNALPKALELCQARDSWFKRQWERMIRDALGGILEPKPDVDPTGEKQEEGINIIWALGPMAEPAIPALIQLLQSRNWESANVAMCALPGAGTNAVPPLLELLNSANQDVRLRAAIVLGDYFGAQAHAAIPVLLRCLESGDQNMVMRVSAIHSLGLIRDDAGVVVPTIIRCMQSETNRLMLLNCLRLLGKFGTNASSAVPALVQILESNPAQPYYPITAQALDSLDKINPEIAQPFIEKWSASRTNGPATSPPASREIK